MSNLQKFNQTLEDLNQEVENFKNVSIAYQKLKLLAETYKELIAELEVNNKNIITLNELQKEHHVNISKSIDELENSNLKGKNELFKLLEEKTNQIRKENKEFYIDLESTIKIKLDENKLNIKQLIENERNQIKQIFENEITKNTIELKSYIVNENKTIVKLIWGSYFISIILILLFVFKVL